MKCFAKKVSTGSGKASAASQKVVPFGKMSSMLEMGIVGMANVGKSATYNLLSKQSVPSENFPFCTIDPNSSIIKVPDSRFEQLCKIYNPASQICATLQITDIAGLVKGASEGEGLGNEFLSHIKSVDGIYQVVRAFENDKILHTEGVMDPVRDLNIIKGELIAKDIQILDKLVKDNQRKAERSKNPQQVQTLQAMQKAMQFLQEGQWLRFQQWTNSEVTELNKIPLLSTKPITFLINQSKKDYESKSCKFSSGINDWVNEFSSNKSQIIDYSVELEQELEGTNSEKITEIITNGYKLLDLSHYFTVGKDEVRCWTIRKNSTAPQAASVIHTDFEKGFVSAEVIHFDEFIQHPLEKVQKKFRKEGKEYIVQDGDIIHFKCKISK
uniref:Obg-like ATPase homolog n=1 Tax=Philasterides dicentrarchi TaxID=282688 RepID=A0A5J6DUW3_9CILI|nr:GTP-binding protein [Philasterides dicentrarchi]